jgi:capsular polysaccharide transport system permease protein
MRSPRLTRGASPVIEQFGWLVRARLATPPADAPPRRWPALIRRRPAMAAPRPAWARSRLSPRALSFIALVLLPTALAAAYYFAIAADQYVAEFRFTLSTIDTPRFDQWSLLSGSAVQSPAALESQILAQYIASRAIVDDIGRSLDLRRLFAPPQADWWSRLAPQAAAIEELVRFWQGQVDPFYDPATGTVTVRVRAFSPDDALRLAQAIGGACDRLVDDLSLRARRDALRQADGELAQAETRLTAVLTEIRQFRDREGLLDPARTAAADTDLAARLHEELIGANTKLATLKNYMRDDAPTVRLLGARIRSLEAQRRLLADRMTGTDERQTIPLSGVLGAFERLQSKQKFAEAAYQLALRGVDEARASADRQHVFVASFVPPSLPEEPLYPRRWRSVGVVALMAFALWAIGGLALQSVRDHLR